MTTPFHELDMVQLIDDHAASGLRRGAVGCIVHDYHDGYTFEVEFEELSEHVMPVVTLTADLLAPWVKTSVLPSRSPPQAAE